MEKCFLFRWCYALCATTWNEAVIFLTKQTCMSMWRRPRCQTALGALWWTIFHICSRFEHKLPQYWETPLTRSGFETMFLHCIKSARFDARLHESMWKCENIHLAADVSEKSPTLRTRTAAGYRAYPFQSRFIYRTALRGGFARTQFKTQSKQS